MPVAVRKRQGKLRIVKVESGRIELTDSGKPRDGGGWPDTPAGRKKAQAQASAINRSLREALGTAGQFHYHASVSIKLLPLDESHALLLTEQDELAQAGAIIEQEDIKLTVQEAHGPYEGLMGLPPQLLKQLPQEVLLEHRDARRLWVVAGLMEQAADDSDGSEAGFHAHALDRAEGKTMQDGPHSHAFAVEEDITLDDGTVLAAGTVLVTEDDGEHEHNLSTDGNETEGPSEHAHGLLLPNGQALQTGAEGQHQHRLMVKVTGLDGDHQHELVIGGITLVSLSAGRFVELFPEEGEQDGLPETPSNGAGAPEEQPAAVAAANAGA